MRKFLTFIVTAFITGSLFAGGLVTNTNQSASWVRLPARNASINIDAVYYNPAGLMKLENGLHFSISNQTISQKKRVQNFYAGPGGSFGLNQQNYEGTVSAPVFPSIYAAYKLDRVAFSLGFNPVGGGGGATFKKGLPSFEMSPSDLVPALQSQGASAYRLDAYFEGSSVFFGLQGGVSFKINDMISVATGMRYVSAKNTYLGHLKDIEVMLPSGWTRADAIMTGISTTYTTAAAGSTALVAGGAGSLTFAQAQTAGIITATQRAQFEGGLTALGYPAATPISTADQIYKGAAAKYGANATLLADQEADVAQTGSGITPIFSVNITPSENLNIAVKYEMATKIVLENKTVKDLLIGYTTSGAPITMFPDGEMTNNDMPAMLALGIDFKPADNLKFSLGSNYFFDKGADYGHKMDLDINSSTPSTHVENSYIIDHNGFSIQGGLELSLSDKLLVSGGYVFANKGVNDNYQNDLTYGLGTHTFGAGGAYQVKENWWINLGVGYTMYIQDDKNVNHVYSGTGQVFAPLETYSKSTMMLGLGLDFSF